MEVWKHVIVVLTLVLCCIALGAGAHSVDITSVVASPSPGTITPGPIGDFSFDVTISYTASGFDPDDRMCFSIELCKPSGGCGAFNECVEVTGPSGSGSVSISPADVGGPSFQDYCGEAYLKIAVTFYDADYGPPLDGDTYTISGYTVDCDCSYSLSSYEEDYPASGGSDTISVTTQSGCPWTASCGADWVDITCGNSDSGNGTVCYTVDPNPGDTSRSSYITIGDQNHHIDQSAAPTHSLTIDVVGQGSTSPSEGVHTYAEGESVHVEASPSSGWQFDRWSGASTSTSESITITMTSDKELTARFEEIDPECSCSTRSLDFGDGLDRRTFQIENDGGGSLDYSISYSLDWIESVNPASGSLDAGKRTTITVRIDRDKLQPGSNSDSLEVESEGGNCSISVSADGPRIGHLTVTIEPEEAREAGAQWRIANGEDATWHDSGEEVDLLAGSYTISFREIPWWIKPNDNVKTVTSSGSSGLQGTYQHKNLPSVPNSEIEIEGGSYSIRYLDEETFELLQQQGDIPADWHYINQYKILVDDSTGEPVVNLELVDYAFFLWEETESLRREDESDLRDVIWHIDAEYSRHATQIGLAELMKVCTRFVVVLGGAQALIGGASAVAATGSVGTFVAGASITLPALSVESILLPATAVALSSYVKDILLNESMSAAQALRAEVVQCYKDMKSVYEAAITAKQALAHSSSPNENYMGTLLALDAWEDATNYLADIDDFAWSGYEWEAFRNALTAGTFGLVDQAVPGISYFQRWHSELLGTNWYNALSHKKAEVELRLGVRSSLSGHFEAALKPMYDHITWFMAWQMMAEIAGIDCSELSEAVEGLLDVLNETLSLADVQGGPTRVAREIATSGLD